MHKLMILVAAREGATDLVPRLEAEAARLKGGLGGCEVRSAIMLRIADDPFEKQYAAPRAYDAVLELVADGGEVPVPYRAAVAGLGERLDDALHADLSGALVGTLRPVMGSGEGPVRFLYLMRHKIGSTVMRPGEILSRSSWSNTSAEVPGRLPTPAAFRSVLRRSNRRRRSPLADD